MGIPSVLFKYKSGKATKDPFSFSEISIEGRVNCPETEILRFIKHIQPFALVWQ